MQNSTTDNTNSNAQLGSGLPGTAADNMKAHLVPASPEAKTVVSQVPAPVAQNVDARTLEGSHAGDTRSEAQGNTNPLRGNDTAPRSPVDDTEGVGA